MIQCKDCEFFVQDERGRIQLRCNPFTNVKEPACLEKWQLLRLDGILQGYQATLRWYEKLGPMQEKMFKFMKREMDDIEEADGWKYDDDQPNEEEDSEDEQPYSDKL